MGMTYSGYIIPKGSVDFKKHLEDDYLDYLMDDIRAVGWEIIDDNTFDREALGSWMGLSKEQWYSMRMNGYCFITIDHIKNAIKVLKDLDERVSHMRFVMGVKNEATKMTWDYDAKEWKWEWIGPEENEAIFREVMKVFNKYYHYIFPWDTRFKSSTDKWWGCSWYIKELEAALENVEDAMTSPDYPDGCEIVLLYY